MKGSCSKGQGVDCRHLVAAVLCELEDRPMIAMPRAAQDLGWHAPEKADRIAQALVREFHPARQVPLGEPVEPGDIVEAWPPGGGPAHGYIVGGLPGLWHAHVPRVVRGGLICEPGLEFRRIWRLENRGERWKVPA